jgi:hypothetical protein
VELLKNMLDRISEYGRIQNMTNMDKIHDLYTQLTTNCYEIDALLENIDKLEKDQTNLEQLERLYENEFMLYMNNVSIHEDLMSAIDAEPRTIDNEFELARIKKIAENLLKVEVVYV